MNPHFTRADVSRTNTNANTSSNKPIAPGWRYQSVLVLASIPILLYTVWQAISLRQLDYLKQRLGFGFPHPSNKPIWLHAASVGEAIAAQPLIEALRSAHPQHKVMVTTMTPTGANIIRQGVAKGDTGVSHCYLPFDWRNAAQRFISTIQPCCTLIMETELWPNLYHACATAQVPLVIVNGRVSSRSLNTSAWVKQIYRNALQNVSAVLARSAVDADGYAALGCAQEYIKVLGNLKYGAAKPLTDITAIDLGRPFVLAASTHDDEELQIGKLWMQLLQQHPQQNQATNPLLVIAPRHPKRSAEIFKQLTSLNTSIAVRSKGEAITDDTVIYLADTLGELPGLMVNAMLVIMGGSFAPVGGHNVLEAAMLGKAILFGPHMFNFIDEAAGLLRQRAALQVDDVTGLQQAVTDLLQDNAKCKSYGDRAQLFMKENRDIVAHYLSEIEAICDFTADNKST